MTIAKEGFIVFFLLCVCTWQANATVNCTATGAGRHPDLSDTTCKNYSLCIYVKETDSYLSYNAFCPSKTLFNPKVSKCISASNYECQIIKPSPKSICTSEGFIEDPYSKNCSSYIECIEINGNFTEWRYDCPNKTYFNPKTTFCESNYNCTTVFTCTAAGRAADLNDITCKKYYYCVELFNGSYAQFNYTCPSTSKFNPKTKLCSARYVCPTAVYVT